MRKVGIAEAACEPPKSIAELNVFTRPKLTRDSLNSQCFNGVTELLHALNISSFGSIDFDFVAGADKRRHVNDEASLEFRRLHDGACRRLLDAWFGVHHRQIDRIRQQIG